MTDFSQLLRASLVNYLKGRVPEAEVETKADELLAFVEREAQRFAPQADPPRVIDYDGRC